MGSLVLTQDSYDGNTTYPVVNGCDATRVYWREGTGSPPTCDSNNYFNLNVLTCQKALDAFVVGGLLHR